MKATQQICLIAFFLCNYAALGMQDLPSAQSIVRSDNWLEQEMTVVNQSTYPIIVTLLTTAQEILTSFTLPPQWPITIFRGNVQQIDIHDNGYFKSSATVLLKESSEDLYVPINYKKETQAETGWTKLLGPCPRWKLLVKPLKKSETITIPYIRCAERLDNQLSNFIDDDYARARTTNLLMHFPLLSHAIINNEKIYPYTIVGQCAFPSEEPKEYSYTLTRNIDFMIKNSPRDIKEQITGLLEFARTMYHENSYSTLLDIPHIIGTIRSVEFHEPPNNNSQPDLMAPCTNFRADTMGQADWYFWYFNQYLTRELLHFNGGSARGAAIEIPLNTDSLIAQQVQVFNQFAAHGGGNASCGYQALKNACGILFLLLGIPEGTEWLESERVISHFVAIADDSHGTGTWRQLIINQRNRTAMENHYKTFIVINPAPQIGTHEPNAKLVKIIVQKLVLSYIRNIIIRLYRQEAHSVELSLNSFTHWVEEQPIAIADPTIFGPGFTPKDIEDYIKNRLTLSAYVNIQEHQCSLQDIAQAHIHYNSSAKKSSAKPFDPNGEWLLGNEINDLANHIKKEHEQLAHIPIIVVDSVNHAQLDLDNELLFIKLGIQDNSIPENQCYAFIVGTMTPQGNWLSEGHWTTLVLDTFQGKRRYTIADSSNNKLRMYAGPCYELIRYLEGDTTAQKIVLPREHCPQGLMGASAYSWFRFNNWLGSLY